MGTGTYPFLRVWLYLLYHGAKTIDLMNWFIFRCTQGVQWGWVGLG